MDNPQRGGKTTKFDTLAANALKKANCFSTGQAGIISNRERIMSVWCVN